MYKKNTYTLLSFILYSLSTQLLASEKNSSLILATKNNNEKLVEDLLQNGADPNSEDEYGNRPIHLAMEWDIEHHLYKKRIFYPNIVKSLLKHKANPNVPYRFKKGTPLHAAVFHNSTEIVVELLYYGAQQKVYDARGVSPLDLAKHYKLNDIVTILSKNTPPVPRLIMEKKVESLVELFYVIDIPKTPFIIDTSKPFSAKKIIDDYMQSNTDIDVSTTDHI
jgi:ankyrin repeat protein